MAIADESGEYVCYAGMWWTPENHLAYMEPLCTIPEYRHKGLAAALSEMYRRTKALGATYMTAPFFEYAYASFSYWMDISCSYKNRIWECDGEIVAFCFYENPVTDIYFCLKPGYEKLAWLLRMSQGNMSAMQECGGLLKIIWHTWNHSAPFPNTDIKVLQQRCLKCIGERRR